MGGFFVERNRREVQEIEEYDLFVEKFKPKKTTDDCYTPLEIYEVIKDWAVDKYSLEGREVVRPFYPGGDYVAYSYPDNCVVIDNPPFSILAEILDFYIRKSIDFFLFANGMTTFGTQSARKVNAIIIGTSIIYENGANVPTNFLTNLGEYKIEAAPDLDQAVKRAVELTKKTKKLPSYEYPVELVTVNKLKKAVKAGQFVKFKDEELHFTRQLDNQKPLKKTLFGGGYLTTKEKGQELEEKANMPGDYKEPIVFELSEREKEIINNMG